MAKALYRRGFRKLPGLILRPARWAGRLDKVVRYEIAPGTQIDVPIDRNAWDDVDVREYEAAFIDSLVRGIESLAGPVTFVDCGADIGIVSLHVAARCAQVEQLVAIEPNSASYSYLNDNVARLPHATTTAIPAAVGPQTGRGSMRSPSYDPSSHAQFLEMHAEGEIDVVSIDSLDIPPGRSIAMKIDVEGGELAALAGAAKTLEAADGFVVALEAHRQVAARTGVDPIECLRRLADFGATNFEVSERPGFEISLDRPLFDQLDHDANVYNVVCSTPLEARARGQVAHAA